MTTDIAGLITSMESYFLSGIFGDGKVVAGNAAAYYRGAARACAHACGVEPELVAPVDSPHQESLRRAYLDEALRHCMAQRIDEGAAALRAYLVLRERILADPLVDGASGVLEFSDPGLENWLSRLLVQRYDATTPINGALVGIAAARVSAEIEATRARAIKLAHRATPRLADDVFCAVPHAILYRAPHPFSGYTNAVPLFVFVGEQMFDTDHFAAELLVHECLHQKLNDISIVRSLFRPGYDDSQSAKVAVPWSFGSNRTRYFTADRTFAAFHVYSHQTLLYLGMAETASTPDEAELAMGNVVLSWARAAHFARAVQDDVMRAEFGPDGHRLAAWLTRAVDDLGKLRLPDGSLLRTHADRYASSETAAH